MNAFQGVAVFNEAYIQQDGDTGSRYKLQAVASGLTTAVSNSFQVAVPQTWTGSPQVQFVPKTIADQASGVSFTVTLQVTNGGTATSAYDTFAHLIVELRDANGNPLPTGPFLEGDQSKNMPTNGIVTLTFTINAPATGKYTLLVLLDLNAQAVLSNAFTVTASANLGSGGGTSTTSNGSSGGSFSSSGAAMGKRRPRRRSIHNFVRHLHLQ